MGLGIAVAISPVGKPTDGENFNLHREIGIEEWEALFLGDLDLPEPVRHEDENREEFHARWEASFKRIMQKKGYKLLARMWHYNRDVFFYPEEVRDLREECFILKKHTSSDLGDSVLKNLIFACEEALRVNSGIWLVSD